MKLKERYLESQRSKSRILNALNEIVEYDVKFSEYKYVSSSIAGMPARFTRVALLQHFEPMVVVHWGESERLVASVDLYTPYTVACMETEFVEAFPGLAEFLTKNLRPEGLYLSPIDVPESAWVRKAKRERLARLEQDLDKVINSICSKL